MNIFYLDENIKKCAQYHCDKHVVKMILESAQILCTVLHKCGMPAPYRPTHQNHPCTLWAEASMENWLWLKLLATELNQEFQYRFDKTEPHKSFLVIEALKIPTLPMIGLTEHAQTMPVEYRVPGNAVSAYRQYYLAEKSRILQYTKQKIPSWVKNH